MSEIRLLIEEIAKSRQALARIDSFCERSLEGAGPSGRTQEKAIVIADLLGKYYTCIETVFLRISQFFENSLAERRWHMDLLDKMTLRIEGVREAVIRDGTRSLLLEFLKFRHFTRYYYDIGYDWDRLDYLLKKFRQLRVDLSADLDAFVSFLNSCDAGEGIRGREGEGRGP